MAKVDNYRASDGDYNDFLNISAPVGNSNAVNHPGDVILIQGLLWYLSPEYRGFSETESPEVTGAFDQLTAQAIAKYQAYVKHRPYGLERYNVIADGRISPAHGKFLFGRSTYAWTIHCLNADARKMALMDGLTEASAYIEDLLGVWPEIEAALERNSSADSALDPIR